MNINRAEAAGYLAEYGMARTRKAKTDTFREVYVKSTETDTSSNTGVKQALPMNTDNNTRQTKDMPSKTTSDIVVKPDGSKVLVVTMMVGGMETTMSVEIAKPEENEFGDTKRAETGSQALTPDELSVYRVS